MGRRQHGAARGEPGQPGARGLGGQPRLQRPALPLIVNAICAQGPCKSPNISRVLNKHSTLENHVSSGKVGRLFLLQSDSQGGLEYQAIRVRPAI